VTKLQLIDEKFLVRTLKKLVSVNSVNPDLSTDGVGELEIGLYIKKLLEALQISSELDYLSSTRLNVIGNIKGSGMGKSLMLNAHMDTVGIYGMEDPFSGNILNGKLYGRGAYDMKASIAAILAMVKALRDYNIKLNGDVILAFVADEEYNSIGTKKLLEKYKTNAAIVTEPTDLAICLGHRGFGVYEISTIGKVAHGGNNREGIDANIKMGKILYELESLSKKLESKKGHPLLGNGSLHIPLIKGGESLFIYSGLCTIKLERRTLPGERESDVLTEIENIIKNLAKKDRSLKAKVRQTLWRNAYEVSQSADIVSMLKNSVTNVLGKKTQYIGHPWWEDSGLIGNCGIETVIIGPKGGGIHQETEWVDIKSVVDLSNILLQTAINYCN